MKYEKSNFENKYDFSYFNILIKNIVFNSKSQATIQLDEKHLSSFLSKDLFFLMMQKLKVFLKWGF